MAKVSFAVIVGDDVAGVVSFQDENQIDAVQRFIAAYRSDPKIVECTFVNDVAYGWKWNGSNFVPPES